jgi:hypothetical protein
VQVEAGGQGPLLHVVPAAALPASSHSTSLSLPPRVFNSAYSRGCCSLASAAGSAIVRGAMIAGCRQRSDKTAPARSLGLYIRVKVHAALIYTRRERRRWHASGFIILRHTRTPLLLTVRPADRVAIRHANCEHASCYKGFDCHSEYKWMGKPVPINTSDVLCLYMNVLSYTCFSCNMNDVGGVP